MNIYVVLLWIWLICDAIVCYICFIKDADEYTVLDMQRLLVALIAGPLIVGLAVIYFCSSEEKRKKYDEWLK